MQTTAEMMNDDLKRLRELRFRVKAAESTYRQKLLDLTTAHRKATALLKSEIEVLSRRSKEG